MTSSKRDKSRTKLTSRGTVFGLATILGLQAIAAFYFVVDGIDDVLGEFQAGISVETAMEGLIAFALCAGIVFGSRIVIGMLADARRQEAALEIARGALAGHISARFKEWGLSAGERDVALFALKGCSVGEIARLRGAAAGTVRSQLSQVYAKAEVNSQSMLVALFIEDLLQVEEPQR